MLRSDELHQRAPPTISTRTPSAGEKLLPTRTWGVGRPNRAGWARLKAGCPFHKSEKKESFGVRLTDGYWHCFACDVGGSIVDFVMRRYGLSFKAATDDYLGAWDDHAPNKRLPTVPQSCLVLDYVVEGVPQRAEIRDEPRNDLQRTRRFYHEAAVRLRELREGASEVVPDETEAQWGILAASWELIQMEVGR